MIIKFTDKAQHSEFQAWRRSNKGLGFCLTQKTLKKYNLHRDSCHHFDDNKWESEDYGGASLTKHPKICSLNRAELKTWANDNNVSIGDTCDCLSNEKNHKTSHI